MKISNQLFPHPVLGIRDDINGNFSVEFIWSCDRYNYKLNPRFNIENDEIEKLINEKKASFLMCVECANTMFRESFVIESHDAEIKINAEKLRDEVNVSFFVIALQSIEQYSNSLFHKDYNDCSFFIEKGDILAYGGETYFIAEKNYEYLKAVSSIMEIVEGQDDNGYSAADFNEEKIKITLNKKNYEIYIECRDNKYFTAVFHTSLVFPLLLKALGYIKDEIEDYTEKKWYKIIKTRIEEENLSLEDEEKHYEILQKLFGDPFNRLFKSLKELNEALLNNE